MIIIKLTGGIFLIAIGVYIFSVSIKQKKEADIDDNKGKFFNYRDLVFSILFIAIGISLIISMIWA